MQFLNKDGLSYLWYKIKATITQVQTIVSNYTINGKKIKDNPILTKADVGLSNVTNDAQVKRSEMGVASGVATLSSDGKVPSSQLALKTVNGQSVYGSGNVIIDLTLYKIVSELPDEDIDVNKIYLVLGTAGSQNTYIEYIYTGTTWEKLGEYKADIDLSPYVKFIDIASSTKAGVVQLGFVQADKKYPLAVEGGKAYVEVPWTDTKYSQATAETLGLVKIGYTQTGNNYPVQLDGDGKMYVTINLSSAPGDHQVTQVAVAATDGEFNLILGKTAGNTAQEIGGVNKANELTYNPFTKKLTVGGQVAAASIVATGAVTGGTVTATGAVTGGTIVKQGGTNEQILMADGSVATPLANTDIDEICV